MNDRNIRDRFLSRRITNILVYCVKVGDADRSGAWAKACDDLQFCMNSNMTSAALRRFGLRGEEVAGRAALQVLDRVRACTMHGTCATFERSLLSTAAHQLDRRSKHGWQEQSDPAQAVAAPPQWLIVLFDVIALSQRGWGYFLLASSLDGECGWQSRLARIYLGAENRASTISRYRTVLQRIRDDLGDALDRLEADELLDSPVDRLCQRLNNELVAWGQGSTHCQDRADFATRTLEMILAEEDGGYARSSGQAELGAALDQVVTRLAKHETLVGQAAEEMCRVAHWTGTPPTGPCMSMIRQLLEQKELAVGPEGANSPAVVLDALAQCCVFRLAGQSRAPEPTGEPVGDQEGLIKLLYTRLRPRTPKWAVFMGLVVYDGDLDRTRWVLRDWLTGPLEMLEAPEFDLSATWLQRATQIMKQWLNLLEYPLGGPSSDPCRDALQWLEIPDALQANPTAINDAINAVEHWSKQPSAVPEVWRGPDGVPESVEPAIRSALLIVILEDLMQDMADFYG